MTSERAHGGPIRPTVDGRRKWALGAVIGLVYLIFPLVEVLSSPHPVFGKVFGVLVLTVFAALYVLGIPRAMGAARTFAASVPVGMFALSWCLYPLLGMDLSVLWIYVAVAGAALFGMRATLAIAVTLAALMIGMSWLESRDPNWELALTLIAVSLWMAGFTNNIRVNQELRAAREELADLAVSAERQRIGRDLHDILGHSLTAIAVKAGLARRLIGSDIAAATREIGEVEQLARDALADVRATAAGMRDVSLAGELAIARSVLTAAGVRAVLPQAVDNVEPAGREIFGYVVREAVTNVVRHSKATRCEVVVTPHSVTVTNDGAHGPAALGSGLRGLTERLTAVGGILRCGPTDLDGFNVHAELADPR